MVVVALPIALCGCPGEATETDEGTEDTEENHPTCWYWSAWSCEEVTGGCHAECEECDDASGP